MLKKENYKGVLVQHMSEKALYKNEKFHIIPKSEQIRFEGAIPAIVSPELWEKANSVISERNAKRHEGVPENPYKNLVFCGHCGKKVTCSFTRKYGKFSFICERCRGTFVPRKILDKKLFEHLKIPENTEITSDFLNEKIERITIFDKNKIIFTDRR